VTRIETISSGVIDLARTKRAELSAVERERYRLQEGDILFSHINSVAHIGKSAKVTRGTSDLFHGMNLLRLRMNAQLIDADYAFHFVSSEPARAFCRARSKKAINQASLSIKDVRELDVPLPPLDEQRRIAAVLSAIDARTHAGTEVARTATAFKNALLHHEFQVAERVLLDDINEAARPICYGILMPGQGHPGGVPVVKVKDIKGGKINTGALLLTTPELDHQYRRSRLRGGDVLLTIRGTTGRVAIVPPELSGANITQDTARLSVENPSLRDWLYYALQAPDVQQQIADNTRGQAVKGINIGDVRKLSIPMPTAAERERVIAVLSATDRLISASLAEVEGVRSVKNAVSARLLGEAA
jgi:restriction endonuclease S subunit